MQTLAMGRQLPLAGGFATAGGLIAFAVFPVQALLPTLLDTTVFIIVFRVVGAPLAVHLTLETAHGPGSGRQFSAKDLQTWGALAGNERNGGGAQVQSNGVVAYHVFGFVGGNALQGELDEIALARSSAPCARGLLAERWSRRAYLMRWASP